nr:xylose isomerase [Salmonella sp. NCTC 7297]
MPTAADAQLGWDTDQFPISVEENALVMYEILKAGGFTTGGLNFDAKVRRQSTDKYDLFYGHIGGDGYDGVVAENRRAYG